MSVVKVSISPCTSHPFSNSMGYVYKGRIQFVLLQDGVTKSEYVSSELLPPTLSHPSRLIVFFEIETPVNLL